MVLTGKETKPLVKTPIPGPKAKAVVAADERHMATTTKVAPIVASRARGVVVEDVDGNRLLDFASGIGVLNVGHGHPAVLAAMRRQMESFVHFAGTDFYYAIQADLAKRLGEIVPVPGPTKTFYVQSGTEANEAAIKVAKAATRRPMFLAFLGAFHGRTQGSLALTASKPRHKAGFFPAMPGVVHVPFPNPYRNWWGIDGYDEPDELANRAIGAIEDVLSTYVPPSDVAGIFWEPVQGEGGYVVPPKPFPRMLRKLADEHGILLCADEVQTGFGRTGKWFASEHFGVQSDTVSLAKAMGSGYPIGACVLRAQLDFDAKGRHSNTYGGNALGCAASLATLDAIEKEGLVAQSARLGKRLAKRLREFQARHKSIGDARGLGLMQAIEFVDAKGNPDPKRRDAVEEACWRRGLVLLACGKSSLRVIPALNLTAAQLDGGLDVLGEALKAAKA